MEKTTKHYRKCASHLHGCYLLSVLTFWCASYHFSIYRVIQEESARLREMIVCVILSKRFIWTWVRFWTVTELWPLETRNRR